MKRVPYVPQLEAVECGAACLTMLLRAHGHHAELPEIREACGVSRDGVSALSIVRVAREYGLVPTARRLEPQELVGVGPAIIHWEMNHFVVLEECTAEGARLVDPAVGPRRVTREEFDRGFTGICIEFTPGEGFQQRRPRRDVLRRVATLLRGTRAQLALVFGASLLINGVGLAVPLFTRLVVDQVIGAGQHGWLATLGPALLALTGYLFLLDVLRGRILLMVRRSLDAAISVQLVQHLLSLPVRFFQQRHSGDLLERVQSTKTLREVLAGQAVALLVDGVLLLSYVALMLALSWNLGLVVAAAGALYGALFLAFRPSQQERFRERVVQDVKQEVQLLQGVQGIVTLKASGREWSAHHRWLKRLVSALNAGWREARQQDLASALLFAVRALVPVVVLVVGIDAVLSQRMSLGTLLGFQMLQFAFLGPLARTIATLLRLTQLPVLLSRLDDVLSTPREPSGHRPCPRLKGEVQFDDVTFRYGPTAPDVLTGLSFTLRPGEKIALVGSSGSGKSTVARLLLGLFAPSSGKILLDGHPLHELELASVRRQLGVVLQETALFDGTVRENICLYHPTAPLEEAVQAARVAQIHDDIQALPLGYDTPLSSTATALSGG